MKKVLMALGASILLSGCAILTKAPDDQIIFTSTPTNAMAVFSDNYECYTPCIRRIDRGQDLDVTFSYKGQIQQMSMKSRVEKDTAKTTVGNVFFFGGIGILFDLLSGKNRGLDTDHVHVEF
jgi:hypothetical protein